MSEVINTIFSSLSSGMSASPLIALSAAFGWGLASILLSPCHLSSIPLIIGMISRRDPEKQTAAAWLLSTWFSLGILISISVIGGLTALAGRMLGDVGPLTDWILAVVFILMGLYLMDILNLDWSGIDLSKFRGTSFLGIFSLGFLFGMVLGPCTFAFLIPVLSVVFFKIGNEAIFALSLLAAFAMGHCILIIAAGTLTEKVQNYLNWSEGSPALSILRKSAGILVISGGIWALLT